MSRTGPPRFSRQWRGGHAASVHHYYDYKLINISDIILFILEAMPNAQTKHLECWGLDSSMVSSSPNLPTKIIHAKIRWLNISGKSPMDMRVPPLK